MKTLTGLTITETRTKDATRIEVVSEKWHEPKAPSPLLELFTNVFPNYYKTL